MDPANINVKAGEKIYKCETCEKGFTHKWNLKDHIKYVHLEQKDAKCKTCEKSFSIRYQLHEHERIHTGSKPFECKTCGKCFRHISPFRKPQGAGRPFDLQKNSPLLGHVFFDAK